MSETIIQSKRGKGWVKIDPVYYNKFKKCHVIGFTLSDTMRDLIVSMPKDMVTELIARLQKELEAMPDED